MVLVFQLLGLWPTGIHSARQVCKSSAFTRVAEQQHCLRFGIRRDVVRAFDFLCWRRNVVSLVNVPAQHGGQYFKGVKKSFFLGCAFGKRIWQIYKFNQIGGN